tara:strand:- start:2269 stop:2412 length:144 start_codon:yes stop_codon:yes gene_type:complete
MLFEGIGNHFYVFFVGYVKPNSGVGELTVDINTGYRYQKESGVVDTF